MEAETDSLNALAWLLDAGADEACGEEPVNRFAAKAASYPPFEGGSKNSSAAMDFSGSGRALTSRDDPSPKFASQISTLPQSGFARASPDEAPSPAKPWRSRTQGEGGKSNLPSDHIRAAMEIAAACNSLAELKAALEAFDGSALKKLATNTVFADGTPAHHIMFIGEAPGREEDRAGLPFVGRAGKLLDKMLAAIGLDRTKNAYITNVLNWRPPDNRDPSPEEAAMCLPFLRRHIELAAPQIMILLGAVAARHVLGKTDGIMRLRGKWLEYHVGGRMIPVMPTLHPAYLLRQPAHKKLAWRDLQMIADKVKSLRLLEISGVPD